MRLPPSSRGCALPASTSWTARSPESSVERALGVLDEQVQALVGGEAAGEADRERVGVERASRRPRRSRAARRGRAGRATLLPRTQSTNVGALAAADGPQLRVRDVVDAAPRSPGRPARSQPAVAQVAVEQLAHRAAEPGRDVDAVRHVADRHVLDRASGQRSFHMPRATSPWRRLTPLAARLVRSANWLMPNGSPCVGGPRAAQADDRLGVDARRRREAARAPRRPGRRGRCRCPPGRACGW